MYDGVKRHLVALGERYWQNEIQGPLQCFDFLSTCFLPSMNPYATVVDCLRANWQTGMTRPLEYRKQQLEALGRFLDERNTDILHALCEDMHKVSVVVQPEVLTGPQLFWELVEPELASICFGSSI